MKQALSILINYLTCTDPVVKNKWSNLLQSFWHKDSGYVLKSITTEADGYKLTLLDGNDVRTDYLIHIPGLPANQPISYITNLQTYLDDKVDKLPGKSLSTHDFTSPLKTKLEALSNYVHPDFHQIADIENLQTHLNTYLTQEDLVPVAVSNNYADLDEKPVFKVVENRYADMAALYTNQASQTHTAIQYVTDASAHEAITAGGAYFEYLGSSLGDTTDYRLLSASETIFLDNKQDLQTITETGAVTNKDITIKNLRLDTQLTFAGGTKLEQDALNTQLTAQDVLVLRSGETLGAFSSTTLDSKGLGISSINDNTHTRAYIKTSNITQERYLELPDASGTLVRSVNGATPDNFGNVVVPVSQQIKVTLTPEQLNNLNTTPIEILPAQGLGTLINVLLVGFKLTFNTTPYSTGDWMLRYNKSDPSLTLHDTGIVSLNAVMTLSQNQYWYERPIFFNAYENTGVSMYSKDGSGGDSTIELHITYQVLDYM